MSGVSRNQRHTKANRCPVCGGAEQDPRGASKRCTGFTSDDGRWCNCSREEHAGAISANDAGLYAYKMWGECKCGQTHGTASAPELGARQSGIQPRIEATYPYTDEHGTLLFEVVRFAGKQFRQRKPSGVDGGWDWKLNGIRRVPYRLPALLAGNPEKPVYIVEGEKDVESLERIGELATCNPGGAGKWSFVVETARIALAGRNVIVIADVDKNDVGQKHAKEVASSLEGVAASVRVMQCPAHKDVSDMLAAGGTLADLVPLAERRLNLVDHTFKPVDEWRQHLITVPRKIRGQYEQVPATIAPNVVVFLRYHPEWSGVLAWDEFRDEPVTTRPAPWTAQDAPREWGAGEWQDEDNTRVIGWLARREGFHTKAAAVLEAMPVVARANPIHPVRDYLRGLAWDGAERLPGWLEAYAGGERSEYASEMGKRWLISAVARVMQPGCQADLTLILEGPQGIGKSRVFRHLVPDPALFSETSLNFGDKDALQALRGKWIYLLDELDGLNRTETTKIKSFLTATKDHYRSSYGRRFRDYPRQLVFAGTTNESGYFIDSTGNRRFIPVRVIREPRITDLVRDRDQLWAEAFHRYRAGEVWWADSAELVKTCAEEQRTRLRHDEWEGPISEFIALKPEVTVGQILEFCLNITCDRWTQLDQNRVARCLQVLGRTRKQSRDGEKRRWVYSAP